MKLSTEPKTYLVLFTESEKTVACMESYTTIKNRIIEMGEFIEITTTGKRKIIIAKRTIAQVGSIVPNPETTIR